MADRTWIQRLRYRLEDFEATTPHRGVACSIKWRTVSGCFDRASSPAAYRLIDAATRRGGGDLCWMEAHSNGPELLVYLAPAACGFTVGADVVGLLVALARARIEGIRQGDAAREPLELIVRRFDARGEYVEQTLLELPPESGIDAAAVVAALGRHGIAPAANEEARPDGRG